jgi:hypothetical protein
MNVGRFGARSFLDAVTLSLLVLTFGPDGSLTKWQTVLK